MNNFDLNINNYNFNDLQKLFKINIDDIENINHLKNELSSKIEKSANSLPNEIQLFFNQAKTIILFIYEFLSNKLITKDEIPIYKNKLTKEENLQTKNFNEVYSFIFNMMPNHLPNKPYLNTDSRINSINTENMPSKNTNKWERSMPNGV